MSDKINEQEFKTIERLAEKLANIVSSKDLGEITIKSGECEISVKGKKCPPPHGGDMPPMMGYPSPQLNANTNSNEQTKKPQIQGKEVKAPIVGTFYAAPSPESAPFVSVGDKVKKGDTIFIIESMKVMSEVTCEFDGVVKEICVNSGDAVEFDQTIMIID